VREDLVRAKPALDALRSDFIRTELGAELALQTSDMDRVTNLRLLDIATWQAFA
jgi:hypothetical protein